MAPHTLKGYLLALLGVCILSPDALLVRLLDADPLLINAWRGLIGGSMVLLFSHFLDPRPLLAQLRPAGWWAVVAIALNAMSQIGFVYGISHANVTDVLVIIAFAPLVSALLSAWLLGETVQLHTWVATLLCSFGLAILLLQPDSLKQIVGLSAAVICALTVAGQFVIMRGFPQANLSGCVGFGNLLAGLLCALLVSDLSLDAGQWPLMLLMALLVSPVPFTLFVVSLRHISAAETSLIMLLESVLGSLWVWMLLAERPSNQTLLAGTLVLGTLAIHSWLTLKPRIRQTQVV
ncbi:MAG: DMT family transporter [Thiolinea sp.]